MVLISIVHSINTLEIQPVKHSLVYAVVVVGGIGGCDD